MNHPVTKTDLEQQVHRVIGASQATGIEQSRAIAEVQAAVAVAHRFPRNEALAMSAIKESCSQKAVADRAFYSFPRGRGTVNGPSIALAVELARCWGNIDYGIMELERDDEAGHTEMLAFAWDLQTNTKSRQTFIVPHTRDKQSGSEKLTNLRDIYENNANNGARRLRECIFRVLPTYARVAAENACRQVLEKGEGDVPLPQRISRTIQVFKDCGVSLERLELRQGPSGQWTPVELANLHILFTSIKNGETSIDEAFPREGVGDTAEKVKALAEKRGAAKPKQSTEEYLDDEIPDFDKRDAAAPADSEPKDAEIEEVERAEGEPEESPARAKLNQIRHQIADAQNTRGLAAVEQEWVNKHRIAFDDEDVALIEQMLTNKKRELGAGK